MNIGARKAVLCTTLIALLAGGLVISLPGRALAQDQAQIESLFEQAKDLWQRGRTAEAASTLKQLLALDPSQEAVYDLLRQVEYKMFLDLLKAGGDAELVAKRLLDVGHVAGEAKTKDEAAIRELVGQAIGGPDYGARVKAVRLLVARHGEYAVPYLYHYLGSNDRDERVNAILALSELSNDAVLPLVEVLNSDNPRIQQNAALVLGKIGDTRALGGLAALHANATNDGVKGAAASAFMKIAGDQGAMPPAEAYLTLAKLYYMKDASVIRNYLSGYTLWHWKDGKLVDRDVPKILYHLELAEEACFDALDAEAENTMARDMLAAVHYAQWNAVDALSSEMKESEEGKALVDRVWNVLAITTSQGADTQLGALALGLEWGDEGIARGALGAMPGVWDGRAIEEGSPLVAALDAPKTVRYAAAVALLHMDPGAPFAGSDKVVPLAAQAAASGSARQVLLIEPDTSTRSKALKVLDDAGMYAVGEESALDGFRRAKEVGTFDVILIRADLKDQLALTIVKNLRSDFRTQATPILITGRMDQLDAARELFGTTVQDFVAIDPLDAARVKEAAAASMNDDQVRALAISKAACEALAAVHPAPHTAYGNAGDAEAALLGVVASDKPDDIRLAALSALAAIGGDGAVAPLAAAFADSANAVEVRAGAAAALGGVLKGKAVPDGAFGSLMDGLGAEEMELRKAAGAALGEMALTAAQKNMVIRKYRVE